MSKKKSNASVVHLEKLNLKLMQNNNQLKEQLETLRLSSFKDYQKMVIAEKKADVYEKFIQNVLDIDLPLHEKDIRAFIDYDAQIKYRKLQAAEILKESPFKRHHTAPYEDVLGSISNIFNLISK